MEMGRLIDYHRDTLIDIDGKLCTVGVAVKHIIGIVDGSHSTDMKNIILSLEDENTKDQMKALVLGSAFGLGSTATGLLALKAGFALVTVTAAPVVGPTALIAGGISAMSGYLSLNTWNDYNAAKELEHELQILDQEREQMKTVMEQFSEAISDQKAALASCQLSLNRLSDHCTLFSKIRGFVLNTLQRDAVNNELLNLIRN